MNGEDSGQDVAVCAGRGFVGAHWACAYAGFVAGLILTALTYATDAFGLHAYGLGPVGLVVIPITVPLLALTVLRGGYRLAALGLFLAAPVLWVSFVVFIVTGGALGD